MVNFQMRCPDGSFVSFKWPVLPRRDDEIITGQKVWKVHRVEHRLDEDRIVVVTF